MCKLTMNLLPNLFVAIVLLPKIDTAREPLLSEEGAYISIFDGDKYNYVRAKAYCQSHYDDTLATIYSTADLSDCNSARSPTGFLAWIGYRDTADEGEWLWSDDEYSTANFSIPWDDNEPNNQAPGEDCACINRGSPPLFNDLPCSDELQQFICNYHGFPNDTYSSSTAGSDESTDGNLSNINISVIQCIVVIIISLNVLLY